MALDKSGARGSLPCAASLTSWLLLTLLSCCLCCVPNLNWLCCVLTLCRLLTFVWGLW